MLQVWRYVFFIYFFYKLFFFSKNLFQQQKKISNRFEICCCCWNKFFEKKCCATKEKYPRTLKIFSWNCNNVKNLLQFHEKVARVPTVLMRDVSLHVCSYWNVYFQKLVMKNYEERNWVTIDNKLSFKSHVTDSIK